MTATPVTTCPEGHGAAPDHQAQLGPIRTKATHISSNVSRQNPTITVPFIVELKPREPHNLGRF
jgi:hypothetical protein